MVSIQRRTEPRSHSEPLLDGGKPVGQTLGDLWRWAMSDLDSNTMRGVVAEFIVGRALGCTEEVRDDWRAYDLITPTGIKVEIKASAYKQTWHQEKDSIIQFGIAPATEWVREEGASFGPLKRHADVYVFCLLNNEVHDEHDPLEINRWKFFVLSTKVLQEKCLSQKTIRLSSLLRLKPTECDFAGLAAAVSARA